jgi:hypothetical protein
LLAAGPGIANASDCASGRRITSDRFLTKERSMRKTLILTLVLCVFAVIAYAQTGAAPATTGTSTTTSTTSSSTGTGTATTTTTTKTKAHKGAKHCTFKCTVVSTDPTGKSFVCHPAKGDDITVKTNEKTKWTPKTCTFDGLKAGDKVSGTCKKDGDDTWALTVKCAAAKKAKAEKPATGASTGTGTGR